MSKKRALQAKAVFGELTLGEALKVAENDFDEIDVYVDGEYYESYRYWTCCCIEGKKMLELHEDEETAWSFLLGLKVRINGSRIKLIDRNMGSNEEIELALCERNEIDLAAKFMKLT
jgi:hypothetical protein